MKRRVKRLLVSMSLCLLLAAAPLGSAKAAGVDSQVNVSYTAQGQQGIGGDGSEGSSTINAGKHTSPVRTGDASLPIAYLAMVMISAGAILLILLKDKKEEKEEESAF